MVRKVRIGNRWVGEGEPAYIIAEVGSNFDGDLEQAKRMVDLSKEVGADAVKFQSFKPEQIIAREGFTRQVSFQAAWKKPVWDVYREAMFPREWHRTVADYCRAVGIDFFSAPYDREAVGLLMELDVPVFKIGSGDITFLSLLEYIARQGKPLILATGASTMAEIDEAVRVIRGAGNEQLILLQCITNYPSPFDQANIRAMVTLRDAFQVPVGYSDHAPGSVVPLGAVALGACVIEKHFTHDKSHPGPDHPFAMDPGEFRSMVRDIRLLEQALGSSVKEVVPAEAETVVIQRRSLYAAQDIPAGARIEEQMVEALRPAEGLLPKEIARVIGRTAQRAIRRGALITWDMV